MVALTGEQYQITYGDEVATVTELGAHLRIYRAGDRDVITGFGEDELPPASHGAILAPWPNRLRDGSYTFDGVTYQLPISEPERATALHGLVSWQWWTLTEHSDSALTLALRLPPRPGYPWELAFTATYRLDSYGLTATLTARNDSATDAPYGAGVHPWLSPGGFPLDECTVRVDASRRLSPDDRLLPTGEVSVAGPFDLREHTPASNLDLDDCYTGLLRDDDGLAWVELAAPDDRTSAVWADHTAATLQVCTGDHLPAQALRRTGLAAEPQTCGPDAFNTHENLIVLEPGESHTLSWGARLI